jgi:hypothetical protein
MDRAVDSATACQSLVGGVHHRVDAFLGDIALSSLDPHDTTSRHGLETCH